MPSIKILFFAAARELAGGVQQVVADVVPAADGDGVLRLGDVRAYLAKTFPGLSPIIADVTLALNMEYVSADSEATLTVQAGDEVALIPPISAALPPSPLPQHRYEQMTEHTAAASAIAAAKAGLQAKATLRGLLQSTLRVTLSDGRVVTGQYQCLDEHLNFILQGATERRVVREKAGVEGSVERQQVMNLGLVMLPGKHVVKVEVKEKGRDPLEIPRAQKEGVEGTTKAT